MSIVLIFDCGATNLRTIAMNDKGKIMASHHLANNTQQGSESPDYHIWDFEEIWQKLTMCADNTITQLKQHRLIKRNRRYFRHDFWRGWCTI